MVLLKFSAETVRKLGGYNILITRFSKLLYTHACFIVLMWSIGLIHHLQMHAPIMHTTY